MFLCASKNLMNLVIDHCNALFAERFKCRTKPLRAVRACGTEN